MYEKHGIKSVHKKGEMEGVISMQTQCTLISDDMNMSLRKLIGK